MSSKYLIWGAGKIAQENIRILKSITTDEYEIKAFIDSNSDLLGCQIEEIDIIQPSEICKYEFDYIDIWTGEKSKNEIIKSLNQYGVNDLYNKIEIGDLQNRSWVSNNKFLLQEIEIETVNRCNGTCPFCPVNVNEVQRPYAKMENDLFYKIIQNLKDLNYNGNLSLFSNNEPFLDERIIDFQRYAYTELPDVKHCMYTNGSLLTLDKFVEIIDYLDYLTIDNYNDLYEVNDSLKDVYEYITTHSEIKNKVNFSFRKQHEVLSSRGGMAPNKTDAKCVEEICLLPFRQMIVRPDGKVSLCCNDALGKYTIGDLTINRIEEVWNSNEYKKIRDSMLRNGRHKLNLCSSCDTITRPGIYGKNDK